MKLLIDQHHAGLWRAFHLLFKERLGLEIYRPIGLEWFENGFWDIAKPYNNYIGTVQQFLQIRPEYVPKDNTPSLNSAVIDHPTHYEVWDPMHGYWQKCLTYDQFLNTDIDVLVATVPDHYVTYKHLRNLVKPKAKVICQMGNMFHEVHAMMRDGIIQNLMASTIQFKTPHKINCVFYHQEIDLNVFKNYPLSNQKNIYSFVIGLPNRSVYDTYKQVISEAQWRAFASDEPFVYPEQKIADKMSEATLGFHVKPQGDGFGHIIYNWGLIGRPIITNYSDYKDKLAGELLNDQTSINLEAHSVQENTQLMKQLLFNFTNEQSKQISERTLSLLNYENEALNIQSFLDSLI